MDKDLPAETRSAEQPGSVPGAATARLLQAFIERRDEASFAELVRIYGPMVYGVCLRTLHDHHAAEDAFQATFMILSRKARSLTHPESLSNWLHGVARQVAQRAKQRANNRQRREAGDMKQAAELAETSGNKSYHTLWSQVEPVLDGALARLPYNHRLPVLLCDVMGLDRISAAAELGWPERTLSYRLLVGREQLAARLKKCGIILSVATLTTLISQSSVSAAVPASLVASTAKAATAFSATPVVPAAALLTGAAALAKQTLTSLLLSKIALAASVVIIAVAGAVALMPDAEAPTADRPLIAPGGDTKAVIAFLQRIIDGQKQADEPLRDRMVRGRIGVANQALPAGSPMPAREVAPLLVPIDWHPFSEVRKNGKARYEEEFVQEWEGREQKFTDYRLADGNAFYSLKSNGLEVDPFANSELTWFTMLSGYTAPLAVFDGQQQVPVSVACRRHIDRLAKGDYFEKFREQLRCYEENGFLVVELGMAPGPEIAGRAHVHSIFRVDPARGYQLVSFDRTTGQPGGGLFITTHCEVEYRELADGVTYPSRGIQTYSSLGTVALGEGRAGWGTRQFEVQSVEFGDFEYDEQLFDVKSLAIPVGTFVTDRRFDPPRTLTYGKAPLEEQILASAIGGQKLLAGAPAAHRWTWIVAANVGLVCAVAGMVLLQRYRKSRFI